MSQPATHNIAASNARHWRRTRTLTFSLLLIWATATFLVVFFARELSGMTLFGWPLSFYMAAQGLVVIYLIIVAVYTWQMRRFDREAALTAGEQQPRSSKSSEPTESNNAK